MRGKITFSPEGWDDYLYWQATDRKILRRINLLLADIQRNGAAQGLGKPEALRHRKGWSRRIDDKERLIYEEEAGGDLYVTSCRGHYEDT